MKVIHIYIHTLINAQIIKDYRVTQNLTQQELADKLGLTRELVNKMEKGKLEISEATELKFEKILRGEISSHIKELGEMEQNKYRENTHFSENSSTKSSNTDMNSESNPIIKELLSQNRILVQANADASASNRKLAENMEQLIKFISSDADKRNTLAFEAIRKEFLVLLADQTQDPVRADSRREAYAELNRRLFSLREST